MSEQVLVCGASGRVGGCVVDSLLDRGVRPRVLVRQPEKAPRPAEVDAYVGDFADADAMRRALDGVRSAFLVSPAEPSQRALQTGFARVAADIGGVHIVKLSGLGTALDSYVDSGRWHAETEHDIRELGLPFTFLRPYFFMQNLQAQLTMAIDGGVIRSVVPDARIAMADVRDIGDVAAAALLGEPSLVDAAVAVTGGEALTYRDIAALFTEALDRKISVEQQTEAAARAALERLGMPEWRRDNLLQFNRAFSEGWGAEVSDVVVRVTGHEPRTVEAFVSERLANPR